MAQSEIEMLQYPPGQPLSDHDLVGFGTHYNKTYLWVFENDMDYISQFLDLLNPDANHKTQLRFSEWYSLKLVEDYEDLDFE